MRLAGGTVAQLLLAGGGGDLVENVVVALARRLLDDADLFEQQVLDVAAGNDRRVWRKVVSRKLAKARRIVVPQRLRIPKGLEQRVRVDHALRDGQLARLALVARFRFALALRLALGNNSQVVKHQLGRLRLARAALAADHNGLVLPSLGELNKGLFRLHKAVGRERAVGPAVVARDDVVAVDGQPLEGVHRDEDGPRVGVHQVHAEAELDVVQDRRLVQSREVVHVLNAAVRLERHALEDAPRLLLLLARRRLQRLLEVDGVIRTVRRLHRHDAVRHGLDLCFEVRLRRVGDPAEAADVFLAPVGRVVHMIRHFRRVDRCAGDGGSGSSCAPMPCTRSRLLAAGAV
mmetsp:Transcript_15002/g.50329  ORF Transcript_15002/g.50329 Transcript_15002/m.50329 type:complete len:347 (-) Transcript_15002:9-1049(-)